MQAVQVGEQVRLEPSWTQNLGVNEKRNRRTAAQAGGLSKKMEDTVMDEFNTKAGGCANQRKRQKEFVNTRYSFEATFQKNPALLKYIVTNKQLPITALLISSYSNTRLVAIILVHKRESIEQYYFQESYPVYCKEDTR